MTVGHSNDLNREVSEASFEELELESVQSNDAAYVAAKADRFRNFDLEVPAKGCDISAEVAVRLRGKLRLRELVELRRMVEGDPRFSILLDRHCKAIHELILCKNPAPVLALLAGLVWSSLSIAWELDTSHMPKARMKMQLEEMRAKLEKVLKDLSTSRSSYLKELVAHRDQLRRFDQLSLQEIDRLVHVEEPVMFYEPLNYLDDDTKVHVSEVVEEKLKLLLKRLQMPAPVDMKQFLAMPEVPEEAEVAAKCVAVAASKEHEDDLKAEILAQRERELDMKEVRLKTQMEEMRASRQKLEGEWSERLQEAEARHSKEKMVSSELKANFLQAQADLTSVAKAARKEWQELAEIRGSEQLPPPEGGNVTTLLTQLFRLESQVREKFQSAVPSASSSSKSMPKSKTDPIAKEVAALEKQRSEMQAQIQQLHQEAEQLKAEASSTRRQQMKELEEMQQDVQKKKLELQDLERQRSEQMKAQELKSQPPSKDKRETQMELEKSQAELQELRKAQLEFEMSKAELQELREAQLEFEKSKAELQELRNAQLEFEKSKAELQELREIKLDFEKSQAEMKELSKTKLKLEKSQAELQALKAQQADQQPRIRSREDTVGSIDHAEVESIICRKASPEVEDPSQLEKQKSIQAQAPSTEAQVEADTAMDKVKMKSRPVKLKATSLAPEPCHKSTQVSIDLPAVPVVSKQRPDAQGELRGENQQLRLEVSRLQKVLVELQQQLHQLAANPESRGDVLKHDFPWKNTAFHLSKVHERLYLDAYERQERQRALQQSIQQAREFEVLDIFRSQHPWLNPLRDAHDISETFAWSICSANWSSVEGAEEATCQAQDKASQKPCQRPFSSRLVPSPRSPEPSDSLEVEGGLPSPQGEILPLVVCSLGGDEAKPVATRPRSSTPTLLGRSETMQSKARRGLPLSGTEATVTRPLRPASAASGLGSRKLQEGLRLLASKPGEAMRDAKTTLTRPKSVGSIRHLH